MADQTKSTTAKARSGAAEKATAPAAAPDPELTPPAAEPGSAPDEQPATDVDLNPAAAPAAAQEGEDPRYDRESLEEGAQNLFGVSRHAVVGALSQDERKTFTLEQAKTLIDNFLKEKVA